MANDDERDILRTVELKKYFPIRRGLNPFSRVEKRFIRAVDGVSIGIPSGKTVAVVGESGCGKTTLARTVMLLTSPTSGEIHFDGKRIDNGRVNFKEVYRNMQIVFQDPDSSLDPQMDVASTISEPLQGLMGWSSKDQIQNAAMESLAAVGLSSEFAGRLPRELSGGQKQRVAIARALAPRPKLIMLDEPTSALDASVQAQIITLLIDLQKKYKLSYMFITHNIAVAGYLSDEIAVMYAGNLVEYGRTSVVMSNPRHPYTIALLSSSPIPNPWNRNLLSTEIKGEVPSAIYPPSGCKFHPRCPYAEAVCSEVVPLLRHITPGRFASCHLVEKTG
jgi:oligopeptide/dipeptide ABC transporter ATP-binding protein